MRTHTNEDIEIVELGKIKTEETKHTVKGENPVIIEDRSKKKSRRHEDREIELVKDDLRVVVFHPDQHPMVRGERELNWKFFLCAEQCTRHRSGWD